MKLAEIKNELYKNLPMFVAEIKPIFDTGLTWNLDGDYRIPTTKEITQMCVDLIEKVTEENQGVSSGRISIGFDKTDNMIFMELAIQTHVYF